MCDNVAELFHDVIPQLVNFAFQCSNAGKDIYKRLKVSPTLFSGNNFQASGYVGLVSMRAAGFEALILWERSLFPPRGWGEARGENSGNGQTHPCKTPLQVSVYH